MKNFNVAEVKFSWEDSHSYEHEDYLECEYEIVEPEKEFGELRRYVALHQIQALGEDRDVSDELSDSDRSRIIELIELQIRDQL